jgi:hypothetical protein
VRIVPVGCAQTRNDEQAAPRAVVVNAPPVRRDGADLREAAGVFGGQLVEDAAGVEQIALGDDLAIDALDAEGAGYV